MAGERVAIIPARGGSKRIPNKNIKEFCGKPIIAWSIEAALKSQCFDSLLVSTDNSQIAEVAVQYGASVPFLRPERLADDHTPTQPVIEHAIKWINEHNNPVDYACCIYPTAPFLSADDLQKGWETIRSGYYNYAFSITSYAFPIQRAIKIPKTGGVAMFYPEHMTSRSQDLEQAWHDAGQFYWGTAHSWLKNEPIFDKFSAPIKVDRHKVQDIDTLEDWIHAEWLFKAIRLSNQNPGKSTN